MIKAGVRSSLLLGCLLLLAASARSQTAFRVSDLDPGPNPQTASSSPGEFTTFQGKVFFAATEASSGRELWVSDGSGTGTRLVGDFCPGTCSGDPRILGAARSALLVGALEEEDFYRDDRYLWRSDGTRAGTFPLTAGGEPIRDPSPAVSLASVLYFRACTAAAGCELWRSDGSPEGTRMVKDVYPGEIGGAPWNLTVAGNRMFFVSAPVGSAELWTSDGTAAGTVLVKSFGPGLGIGHVAALGSKLLLLVHGQHEQDALWVSDGTAAGTRPVSAFTVDSPFGQTSFLKALGGKVYFAADDVVHGAEIWASDGTPTGTKRVTEFGFFDPFRAEPHFDEELRASDVELLGDRLVFWATDGLTGFQPWATKGTPESTEPLCPGCAFENRRAALIKVGGKVLFAGRDAAHGLELWASDGTARGTVLVRDLCPGPCDGAISEPVALLGTAFLQARSSATGGSELWRSDGTPAGTRRFAAPGPASGDSGLPATPVALGRTVFYGGSDGKYGVELWAGDGTAGGTRLVADVNGGSSRPGIVDLTPAGERLYFSTCRDSVFRLWWTRDAPETTREVPDLFWTCPTFGEGRVAMAGGTVFFSKNEFRSNRDNLWRVDADGSTSQLTSFLKERILDLVPLEDRLFFTVYREEGPVFEIWRSDGTVAGTVKAVELPSKVYNPSFLTVLGSEVWFLADDGNEQGGTEVWRTDGTQAGTRKAADCGTWRAVQDPDFTRVGSTVFFFGPDEDDNHQLWKTDGTPEGAALVRDLDPDPYDLAQAAPSDLTAFQGAAYFFAATAGENGQGHRGLWRSDGTAAGTVLVRDFLSDGYDYESSYFFPTNLVALGSSLLLAADDGVHGRELWRSDGTASGTVLLRDLFPGSKGSAIGNLQPAGGRLYFSAHDGLHGFELWRSDGTEAGTRLVQDIAPLGASSHPGNLTLDGDRLFFTADDGASGEEIWVLPLSGPACQPSATALCLGDGRFRVEVSWRDFSGNTGSGQAVKLTGDTGYFWFFSPENVEVVLKVLDGQGVNGHHWVFYGALSNVEYMLTVTDTRTGLARRYFNPAGRLASAGDTTGFGPLGAYSSTKIAEAGDPPRTSRSTNAAASACVPSARRLCLNGGRFAVEATWKDFSGRTGSGTAVSLTGDTGYFWFFDAANVEAVVKVLDGQGVNGHHWVFYGALSNVEYTLTVTDTTIGAVKTYKNPSGRFASVADTEAF